jgi:DNA-binding NtrC family response regulator
LARHFARRAATRFGLFPAEPTEEDLSLLMAYSWPGNVRELATVIDRAAILGDGKRLEVATALGIGVHPMGAAGLASAGAYASAADGTVGAPGGTGFASVFPANTAGRAGRQPEVGRATQAILSLDAAMREHIERALAAAGGRIEGPRGAARMLQINPHTLRARMRKLKIEWDRFRQAPPAPAAGQ